MTKFVGPKNFTCQCGKSGIKNGLHWEESSGDVFHDLGRVGKWINVKDRLPQIGLFVLVNRGYLFTSIAVREHYGWDSPEEQKYPWRFGKECKLSDITHWMPLPQPPEE